MSQEFIYLDYNATTPVDPRVLKAMEPYHLAKFANVSSVHLPGLIVSEDVEQAWDVVAAEIGCRRDELILTSGATESINLAIKGLAHGNRKQIVVLATEHQAVMSACRYLQDTADYDIQYASVSADGLCDWNVLQHLVTNETMLVCAMLVNNETGIIQDIPKIANLAHRHGAHVLCDATQSYGKMAFQVNTLGVDLLAFSAHKCYGPKGVGALYIRSGLADIIPQIHGGNQQRGLRSGTFNVPGLIGLAEATQIARTQMEEDTKRIGSFRDRLEEGLLNLPGTRINGDRTHRLYTTTNILFEGVNATQLMRSLGSIAVSNGSACSAATMKPSHVLTAMGLSEDEALGAIRFSLGRYTTEQEIQDSIETVTQAVMRMRHRPS